MLTGFEQLCDKYRIVSVAPLIKGWSGDKKYILENGDGERYVLRLSKSDLYEKKKNQFELLKKIERLGLNCSRPIEFGVTADGVVYTLCLIWKVKTAKPRLRVLQITRRTNSASKPGSV